ncbi:MAG: hypothetical protein ACKVOH_04945, partial [Chlamydiales bacterium]
GNFLGVDTGGCALALDPSGITLMLKASTSAGTSPQENWDWLHRILSFFHYWNQELSQWKEFTPLTSINIGVEHGKRSYPQRQDIRA